MNNNAIKKYSLTTVLTDHVLPSEMDAVAGGFFFGRPLGLPGPIFFWLDTSDEYSFTVAFFLLLLVTSAEGSATAFLFVKTADTNGDDEPKEPINNISCKHK